MINYDKNVIKQRPLHTEDLPKRMPQEDWVTVDVITIAAPDLRDKSNIHVPLVDGGTYMMRSCSDTM